MINVSPCHVPDSGTGAEAGGPGGGERRELLGRGTAAVVHGQGFAQTQPGQLPDLLHTNSLVIPANTLVIPAIANTLFIPTNTVFLPKKQHISDQTYSTLTYYSSLKINTSATRLTVH